MGQVRDPQLVGPLGGEVPLDEIDGPASFGVRPGGSHLLCPLDALDPELSHEPSEVVAADVVAGSPSGYPQLACPIDRIVGLPQRQQHRHQLSVAHSPRRLRPALGGPIHGRSHLQRGADGLNSELIAVLVNEPHSHRCRRSSFAPKKVAARCRISFARRNSRFS